MRFFSASGMAIWLIVCGLYFYSGNTPGFIAAFGCFLGAFANLRLDRMDK